MPQTVVRTSLSFALFFAFIFAGPVAPAGAAGFFIQEQSVSGLGAAFSGAVSNLNDPGTIFFNPAGMTKLDGLQIQAGVNILMPHTTLTDTGSTLPGTGNGGNPYDPTPVPNGFLSYEIGHGFWAGIGITTPFGLANKYDDGWFGRFDSTKTELAIIDIQPTLAWRVNGLISVGGGLNIQHSDADLQSVVNFGLGEYTSRLKGSDLAYGYSFGVRIDPVESTTIGINYKSSVRHHLDGKIEVTSPTGALFAALSSDATARLVTPDHFTFGAARRVTGRLTLQGQATWFGWNNFDTITAVRNSGAVASIVPQNYQTAWSFAGGAEYEFDDRWTLRGGVQFDQTPTTDEYRTSRTPDGDRTWVSLGATCGFSKKIDLDMAATYISLKDEEIDVLRNSGAVRVKAGTEGDVGILALGLTYKF